MGGSSSAYSYWTAEETALNEKIQKLQEKATEFVSKNLFYAIAVRSQRKSRDPTAPIWIEPLPQLVEETLLGANNTTNNDDILKNVPTGVLIDSKANIKVLFTFSNLEYFIPADDFLAFEELKLSTLVSLPLPNPPKLDNSTENSVTLSWRKLPYAVGIIDCVEVQFAWIVSNGQPDCENADNLSWSVLAKKHFSSQHFQQHTYDHVPPGRKFRFRLKYRCWKGWSEFSESSDVFATRASRPVKPSPPVCIAITSYAVELQWDPPYRDNGACILEYVLLGKSVGDVYVELYRGQNCSFLALGLYPEFGYSFEVAARNIVGLSDYSDPVSVHTPPPVKTKPRMNTNASAINNRTGQGQDNSSNMVDLTSLYTPAQIDTAMACRDAWLELWDPKTEQQFYFNTILATRQLDIPTILLTPPPSATSTDDDTDHHPSRQNEEKVSEGTRYVQTISEEEKIFRKKRYHLLRSLHKRKKTLLDEHYKAIQPNVKSPVRRAQSITAESSSSNGNGGLLLVQSGATATSQQIRSHNTMLTLQRASLLPDFCALLEQYTLYDLLKRFKVEFVKEEGIDAGGLSKEAFLLLSRALVQYGLEKHWLKYTASIPSSSTNNTKSMEKEEEQEGLTSSNDAPKTRKKAFQQHDLEGIMFVNASAPSSLSSSSVMSGEEKAKKSPNKQLMMKMKLTFAQYGKYLGTLLGKAILDRQLVDVPLSSILLNYLFGLYGDSATDIGVIGKKSILFQGKQLIDDVNYIMKEENHNNIPKDYLRNFLQEEMIALDKSYATSLLWMMDHDITNIIDETFTITVGTTSSLTTTIPLCPTGECITVTEINKYQYLYLIVLYHLKYSIQDCLSSFMKAFYQLIPLSILQESEINNYELQLILNGKPIVQVEELRAYCLYQGDTFYDGHEIIAWFWRCMRDMIEDEKRQVLIFFTGSSRVPLDGYDPPLTITEGENMAIDSLPQAHTCFNQLVLPYYSSYEKLKEKILFAIENTEGFGMA